MFFLHLLSFFYYYCASSECCFAFYFSTLCQQDGELNAPLPTACLLLWGSGSNRIQRGSGWVEVKSSIQSRPASDTEESYVRCEVSQCRDGSVLVLVPCGSMTYSSSCPEDEVLLYRHDCLWSLYLLLWSFWNVGVGTQSSISSIFLGL